MAMGIHASAARRRGRSARTPMAEINVTPLVDVMLVLLIIFMVTAPLLKAAVPIELPDSRAKALSEDREQLSITIDRAGKVYLENEQLAPGELPERLAAVNPDPGGNLPLVTLRADKALDYGTVIAVMDELNRAGFTSISLVTTATGAGPPVISRSEGGE